jgi:hypothetical protein
MVVVVVVVVVVVGQAPWRRLQTSLSWSTSFEGLPVTIAVILTFLRRCLLLCPLSASAKVPDGPQTGPVLAMLGAGRNAGTPSFLNGFAEQPTTLV